MQKINPYNIAFRSAIKRLIWDVSPYSWLSKPRLAKLRNQHSGQKAIIICNGPSLLKTDLNQLKNIYTFGLNKINLLFENVTFRPSSIVAVNNHVLDQNRDFYSSTDIPLFLGWRAPNYNIPLRSNIFLQTVDEGFAEDCSISVGLGSTVTYVAMQLAFHMGFKEVALVGCDHNFETKGPPDAQVASAETDPNHFHPDYFSGGMQWNLPNLVNSERAYLLARQRYSENGRRLVNCTVGGMLEVLDRCSLEDFVAAADV